MDTALDARANNFDFMRLVAAAAVVIGHSYWLSGRLAEEPIRRFTGHSDMADIAVNTFFVMSGYLIFASWQNSHGAINFAGKRALRIFPALAVSIVLTVLVIGPLTTDLPLIEYLLDKATLGYLSNMILVTNFHLPGVFQDNIFPGTVNGSVWTLPYEAFMYLSVMALGMTRLLHRVTSVIPPTLLLVYFCVLPVLESQSLIIEKACRLGMFFYSGALLYQHRRRLPWSWKIAVPLLGLTLAMAGTGYWFFVHVLTLPYLVIYLARLRSCHLSGFGKYGDFSYGLYIFSFPLQQALIHWAGPQLPLAAFMLLGLAGSLALAILSWHLVEAPALALKRYLPRASHRRPEVPGAPVRPESDFG